MSKDYARLRRVLVDYEMQRICQRVVSLAQPIYPNMAAQFPIMNRNTYHEFLIGDDTMIAPSSYTYMSPNYETYFG
jgi:hypothetical protein